MYLSENQLGKTEADIMAGAISLSEKHVGDIMTPREGMAYVKIS